MKRLYTLKVIVIFIFLLAVFENTASDLKKAIWDNDIETIKVLIKKGVDVSSNLS